jgi:RNA polymerase sigma-70 factor (ECF subfamily)
MSAANLPQGAAVDQPVPAAELLQRLRGGDAQAAEALFARYARELVRVAERHLSQKLAGRVDGEDVVQSVFRTFFRRSAAGEFRVDASDQLWRLLVTITLRKARAKGRFHTAAQRDAGAEAGGDAGLFEAAAREPGPDDAAALVDQIEALLQGLPPLYARLLDLKLQGHTVVDVAAELGVSRQTVHRALNLLQERLAESVGE